MHRNALLDKLRMHETSDDIEEEARQRILAFVQSHSDCFERTLEEGHITGAGWVVNSAGTHVLLTHHRKLRLWLQLGGHADGDPDILNVALREAREESGIESIRPVTDRIFDVDVHRIPAHGLESAHFHYDIRFLLHVDGDLPLRMTEESIYLAWVPQSEVPHLNTDESLLRMHRKLTALTHAGA